MLSNELYSRFKSGSRSVENVSDPDPAKYDPDPSGSGICNTYLQVAPLSGQRLNICLLADLLETWFSQLDGELFHSVGNIVNFEKKLKIFFYNLFF